MVSLLTDNINIIAYVLEITQIKEAGENWYNLFDTFTDIEINLLRQLPIRKEL
jgi:hypothetical protein